MKSKFQSELSKDLKTKFQSERPLSKVFGKNIGVPFYEGFKSEFLLRPPYFESFTTDVGFRAFFTERLANKIKIRAPSVESFKN